MRTKFSWVLSAAVLLLAGGLFTEQENATGAENPVADWQLAQIRQNGPRNRDRIQRTDGFDKSASAAWFVVEPMSDVMRTPDVYPEDGTLSGTLRAAVAQNEYEPVSFQLFSFSDRKNVRISVSDLKTKSGGQTIPAKEVAVKIVKCWYQAGNGWLSYFADSGLKLTPELLLNDENMVRVDLDKPGSYARLQYPSGEKYVWISAPNALDSGAFDPMAEPFADAKTLQPFALTANQFKQFWATVHVPANQSAGIYNGTVTVADDSGVLCRIPLAVRVLPFELPEPRTYFDVDKLFLVSFFGPAGSYDYILKGVRGDTKLAQQLQRDVLASYKAHNFYYPNIDQDELNFRLLKEAGLPTKPVFMGKTTKLWNPNLYCGGRMTFDQYIQAKDGAYKCAAFYDKLLGHHDVYIAHGDEYGAAFAAANRPAYYFYQKLGIHLGLAGSWNLLYKGGYMYDYHPFAGNPNDYDKIRPWNGIGDKFVGFYANQHNGAENPNLVRRQHGLMSYLNDQSMADNYQFNHGPWNDLRETLYRAFVVGYMNRGGLIDTLQYEGFREAIDDIRYATQLKLLCREALKSENVDKRIAAKKALQFLALLNSYDCDLSQVRAEIVNYILTLDPKTISTPHTETFSPKETKSETQTAADEQKLPEIVVESGKTIQERLTAAADKFKENYKGAFKSYSDDEILEAQALYESIATDPSAANLEKIAAYQGIADCWLARFDAAGRDHVKQANETLQKAVQLPNLTNDERFAAKKNVGIAFQRELAFDKAIVVYSELLNTPELKPNLRDDLRKRITESLIGQGQYDEAARLFAEWEKHPIELANLFRSADEFDRAKPLYLRVLDTKPVPPANNPKAQPDDRRADALRALFNEAANRHDWTEIRRLGDKYLPSMLADNPARNAQPVKELLNSWTYNRSGAANHSELQVWAAQYVLGIENLPVQDRCKFGTGLALHAGRIGDLNAARAAVKNVLETPEIKPQWVAEARMYDAVLASNGNPAGIEQKVLTAARQAALELAKEHAEQMTKQNKPIDPKIGRFDAKAEADYLSQAGKFAVDLGYYDLGKQLNASRNRRLNVANRPSIPCRFLENGPRDVSSYLASAWFQNKANRAVCTRPYGEDLQFLLATDVASGNRTLSEDAARETEVAASCDEDGLVLFYAVPTDDPRGVADGLKNLGGIESYLATGPVEPYDWFMINFGSAPSVSDHFASQYNNANYRRTSLDDKNVSWQFGYGSGYACCMLRISWSAFFNRLPSDGSKWEFDALTFEGPAKSWGGSWSVHQRSNFGDLRFENLTAKNRTAIKRNVLAAAKREYQAQISSRNGFLEFWKDSELGDRDFYLAKVKPIEDDLSTHLDAVKPDMTESEVNAIFDKAALNWMNVRYQIAALRKAWLANKFTTE